MGFSFLQQPVVISSLISFIAGAVTSIISPMLKHHWEHKEEEQEDSATVEVARMDVMDKFQERLLNRIEELEERICAVEKAKEEKVMENVKLQVEYSRIEKLAADLRDSKIMLDMENESLRKIIIQLNNEVVSLETSIDKLRLQLNTLSCNKLDCTYRKILDVGGV